MKTAMKEPEATRPKFVLWMDADAVPVDFEVGRSRSRGGAGVGQGLRPTGAAVEAASIARKPAGLHQRRSSHMRKAACWSSIWHGGWRRKASCRSVHPLVAPFARAIGHCLDAADTA